jgi:uncharacterized protein (TIGR03437 family)
MTRRERGHKSVERNPSPGRQIDNLMRIVPVLALFLLSSTAALGQTVVNAVTDAASYAPRVAPGALATIFGSNLADGTAQASGFPLPRSLANATVFVNQSPVPLLYASKNQINFQVPSNLVSGTASLYVTRDGGNSLLFEFTVTSSAPGIFQDSKNHAIAQNASAGYTLNSSSAPAAVGSVVVVYLNGPGAVDHPVPDGTATPSSPLARAKATPAATIGGVNAPVQFLGLTPGFTGLAQANIQVPATLATGDYPLVITAGSYRSASALLSVSGSGSAPPSFLTKAGRVNFANDSTSAMVVNGNITYVCGLNRIRIIDTSNVSSPVYVGEFGDADLNGKGGKCTFNTSTSRPILVDIVGPGSAPTFAVYDLSNPTQPVKLAQQSTGTKPYVFLQDLSFIGTTGFASTSWYEFDAHSNITSQHGDFLAYDFSSFFPVLISAMASSGQPASSNVNVRPNALALPASINYPNTAYVASTTASGASTVGNAALDVIDVSNVQSMQGVTRVTVADSAIFLGFAYDDTLLFLTGNTTGFRNPGIPDFNITGNLTLTTMDISNVQNPFEIVTTQTNVPTTGTYTVQPFGSNVFAIINNPPAADAAGPGSLMIVDARATNSPVLYPLQTQFGLSGLAAINGFLLVPDLDGLTIYTIKIP